MPDICIEFLKGFLDMTIKTYSKWIRVISMLLAFVMVLGVMPLSAQNLEASFVSEDAQEARVKYIMDKLIEAYDGTKWTYNGQPGQAYSYAYEQSRQCNAFAHYVFNILFNIPKIGTSGEKYKLTLNNNVKENVTLIIENINLSDENLYDILKANDVKMGTFIQVQRKKSKNAHSMILYDYNEFGITVFECNADGNCTIAKNTYDYEKFRKNNECASFYGAYDSQISSNYNVDTTFECVPLITYTGKDENVAINGGGSIYSDDICIINAISATDVWVSYPVDGKHGDGVNINNIIKNGSVDRKTYLTSNDEWEYYKIDKEYAVSKQANEDTKINLSFGYLDPNLNDTVLKIDERFVDNNKWIKVIYKVENIIDCYNENGRIPKNFDGYAMGWICVDSYDENTEITVFEQIDFISPSNNATLPLTNAGVSLSWTAIANADSYHLAVRDITNSTAQNGPADAYYRLPGNKTAYTLKNLENNGVNNGMLQDGHTYRLWICAYDANENAVSAARELVITVERKMDTQTWWQDYNPTIDSRITADLIQKYLNTKPNSILNHVCMVNGEMMLKVDGEYFNLGFDNYFSVSNSLVNNNLKDESIARTLTPAQIIYEACIENETNVAYILATLDKEQGLLSAWQNTYGANQQVRLNLATGYKANKVKYEGFIGQIIGTTYVTYKNAKANKSFAETYEQYTPSSDPTNASFNYFIEQYYNKVAAWFDAELGITDDMGGVSRDVVLILDGSGSMSSREFNETKQAALLFAEEVLNDNTNTNIAIMAFGNNNYLFKKNANDSGFYNTVEDIEAVLSKGRQPGGATYMADALLYADALLETRVSDRKVIMLMSDGEANGYTSHAAQYGTSGSWGDSDANVTYNVANALTKNKNYYIYTLGFGLYENSRAEKLLKGIADLRSECTYQKVDKVEDLRFGFEENADNIVLLENQILITIACPVEVYVRYNGEMLSSDPAYLSTATSFGTLSISEDGETKTLKLLGEYDYDINIYGTDEGTMTVTVKYPGKAQEVVEFKDVPVTSYMSTKFNTDNSQPIVMYYASGEDSYEEVIVPNQQYNGETSFDVTYIVDGVIFANETYHIGEIITPSVVPEKEGYIFAGWSGMPKQMPATNIVLEAEWTKQSPTDIIFDYWTMMMIVLRNKK